MASFPSVVSLALLAALGGCATISASNQQLLTVHVISENREIGGVGCVLSNDVGRWFTTAPGRVMVTTSTSALAVHCSKPGEGTAREQFNSRYAAMDMVGNVVTTVGVGYLIDRHSGAGFAYPENVTVLMSRPQAVAHQQLAGPENVVW
ncbi:hypothetical protein [Massilia sp. S19_KUP03_FR1]|uniref:hypothetical protein n=1 Tax=Massilia sp. S19_KUP03_FR1 TaxID=3025503 RepID=UPI002FCDB005